MSFRVLLMAFVCIPFFLKAQEMESKYLPPEDTLKFSRTELFEPGLIFPGTLSSFEWMNVHTNLKLSTADFSEILKSRWKVDYSVSRFFYFPSGFFQFPNAGTGMIFNQASWKASPKLTVIGSSLGISSPFHAPLPGSASGGYPVRGMSVFMEYKISPNLRIGGGVTVTGHQP